MRRATDRGTSNTQEQAETNVVDLPLKSFLPNAEQIQDYDLWHIPPKDHVGHYERMGFQVPPHLYDAVQRIVQSRQLPFRNPGYFGRAALKIMVDLCLKLKPDICNSVFMQAQTIIDILRHEEMDEEFGLIFERLSNRVAALLAKGAKPRAVELLIEILNNVRKMPQGFYRNQYLTELKEKYGEVLEGYGVDWDSERQAPVMLGEFECIGEGE